MQTRLAVFFCAASLAGAFSGFLAFALMKMDGVGGLEGWRWYELSTCPLRSRRFRPC